MENCSGTTAAVVVVKDLMLLVGNAGDSEIVICGKVKEETFLGNFNINNAFPKKGRSGSSADGSAYPEEESGGSSKGHSSRWSFV